MTAQEYYEALPNIYTKARIARGENVVVRCKADDGCAKGCRGFRIELSEMAEHFGMDVQSVDTSKTDFNITVKT